MVRWFFFWCVMLLNAIALYQWYPSHDIKRNLKSSREFNEFLFLIAEVEKLKKKNFFVDDAKCCHHLSKRQNHKSLFRLKIMLKLMIKWRRKRTINHVLFAHQIHISYVKHSFEQWNEDLCAKFSLFDIVFNLINSIHLVDPY